MRPGRTADHVEGVDGLSALLKRAGLVFGVEDLADALWLAEQIGTSDQELAQGEASSVAQVGPTVREEFIESEEEEGESEDEAFAQLALSRSEKQQKNKPSQIDGIPFKAPAASALRISLDLSRALRPLRQMVLPSGQQVFDEAATVEQIADQHLWSPVLRPAPEQWLDLALVVEDAASLMLWKETIREFQTLVERQGAFRRVTTWRLKLDEKRGLELFQNWKKDPNGRRSSQPEQLLDPAKRRLILLLSDCTSEAWHSGKILDWLEIWGEKTPVAVLQFLPQRLWSQTSLGKGVPLWFSALEPGIPSEKLNRTYRTQLFQQLVAMAVIQPESGKKIRVPVVPLEAEPLKQWAKVVAGFGEVRTTGVEFERLKFGKGGGTGSREVEEVEESGSLEQQLEQEAQQRVQRFRATASLMAQRLAGLMAAAPVDPVIVNVIRQQLLPQAETVHVAEVFMGGLMDAEATDDGVRYDFPVPVRDLLAEAVPRSEQESVLDEISAYISERLGLSTRSFEALLGVDFSEDAEAEGLVVPFAQVAAQTLARMGDEYAVLAERVRTGQTVVPPPKVEEVGDVFPLLQTFKFREATLSFPAPEPESPSVNSLELEFAVTAEIQRYGFTAREAEVWQLRRKGLSYDAIAGQLFISQNTVKKYIKSINRKIAAVDQADDQRLENFEFETALLYLELNDSDKFEVVVTRRQQRARQLLEELAENVELEMVLIPSGSFVMGSPEDEEERTDAEGPQHEVTFAEPFLMGKYPVTQAQWRVVAGMPQVNRELNPDPSNFKGANRPVEKIDWNEAVEFCDRLSNHTGRPYRLPTEAEWEYACRAKTTTPFHFGETLTTNLANYDGNYTYGSGPKGEYREETTDCGSFPANAFGLYDMHGNVDEWCQDHWHGNYDGAPTDGSAWLTPPKGDDEDGSSYVLRGGSWYGSPVDCRSASRFSYAPVNGDDSLGLRVVCALARA